MNLNLTVQITDEKTSIHFENSQDRLTIVKTDQPTLALKEPAIFFLLKENQLLAIGQTAHQANYQTIAFDKIITLTPAWEIELDYLEQLFVADVQANGIQLLGEPVDYQMIPKNQLKTVTAYKEQIEVVLENFGYRLNKKVEPKKAKPAKARHKWTKEVSQIEFHVDTRQSKATVLWQKRNEMLIKAGATMMPEAPLNKDGSVGFSAKMGDKIRDDHKHQFKNFVTTEDIILKSVNEVGLFLYYAGTNSWLELIDDNGKTINEWTVVE